MDEATLKMHLRGIERELDAHADYYRNHPLAEDHTGRGEQLAMWHTELTNDLEQLKEKEGSR